MHMQMNLGLDLWGQSKFVYDKYTRKAWHLSSSDLPSGQGDKTGTMLSDGAIYSSIDFTTKANYNSPGQTSQATPYATTQILHSSSIHELAVDLPDPQWKASLQAKQEMASLGYSLPEKTSCNNSKWGWGSKRCLSLFLCENGSELISIPRLCLFSPCDLKGN